MTSPKYEARIRTRTRNSLRNENHLSSSKFKQTLRFYFSLFFQLVIQRVPFEQHTRMGVFGTVRIEAYRRNIYTAGITGTGHFGKFGTTSIPAPNTSVNSVRRQYRYRHFGNF